MDLVELVGSEKQVAWATEIRNNFISRYENTSDKNIQYFTLNNAAVMRKAAESMIRDEKSSKFYIEELAGHDLYKCLFAALDRYINIKLSDKQQIEERKHNIKTIHDDYCCVIELREIEDKFQFTAIKYPAVIEIMEKTIKAKEISYNEYGQFIWEQEKEPGWNAEIMSEWLQDLGFAVCLCSSQNSL